MKIECELENERCGRLKATQVEVVVGTTMCEMVVGDRLKGLKGVVRLEKGDTQADCQQSSASGNENGERQGRNEEVMLRRGLKPSPPIHICIW